MKRPSFQFYPGDWMRDSALRSCSVGARGLWMDAICLMHEGTPYGYLKVNLKVILAPNLARMVGATLAEVEGWLGELEGAGVFSRDEEGAIYSRRMIRDENIREARASGGKLGGNPALKDKGKVDGKVNLPPNLWPTPSSSSSSSDNAIPSPLQGEIVPIAAKSEKAKRRSRADDPLPALPASIDTPEMRDAWSRWLAAREAARKPVHAPGAEQCFRDFQKWGVAGAIASIEKSIRCQYQGIFPPDHSAMASSSAPVRFAL